MHTAATIIALLEKNDNAVLRGLRVIKTLGFVNDRDGKFGDSLINYLDERGGLTERQLIAARRMVIRYAFVLARVANEKANKTPASKPSVNDDVTWRDEEGVPNWDKDERAEMASAAVAIDW